MYEKYKNVCIYLAAKCSDSYYILQNPTGGYSAYPSSGEFSLQVPGCKLEVFKHGYGRKLEVETLSITGNSDYKNKIK